MPGNGIDWEGLTGKPMEEITVDDKFTVMISKLINIEKCTKNNSFNNAVIKAMIVIFPIALSVGGWFIVEFLRYIGK